MTTGRRIGTCIGLMSPAKVQKEACKLYGPAPSGGPSTHSLRSPTRAARRRAARAGSAPLPSVPGLTAHRPTPGTCAPIGRVAAPRMPRPAQTGLPQMMSTRAS